MLLIEHHIAPALSSFYDLSYKSAINQSRIDEYAIEISFVDALY